MRVETVQRLRITYGIEGALCYASVLDMGRLWERLLRRAKMPLAYTQGFNPRPRLQFASALPVGYSSACELLDVLLSERVDLLDFAKAITHQAPAGLRILQVDEVSLKADSPHSTMHTAHYRVRLQTAATPAEIEVAIQRLLAQATVLRERIKKGKLAAYDLRPLIDAVHYAGGLAEHDGHELQMVLHCGPEGAGRPEEVVEALDLSTTQHHIHRTRLEWGDKEEHSG